MCIEPNKSTDDFYTRLFFDYIDFIVITPEFGQL